MLGFAVRRWWSGWFRRVPKGRAPRGQRRRSRPQLEILEARLLLDGVSFDSTTGVLSIVYYAGAVTVDSAGNTDFVRVTQEGGTSSSDPTAADYDPALAGATQSALKGIKDDATDTLTLLNLTVPGDLEVDAPNVLQFGDTTVDGTLTFQGNQFEIDGTPTVGSLLLGSGTLQGDGVITGPVSVASGSTVAPGFPGETAQLTVNNGITFASGSSLAITMESGGDPPVHMFSQLVVPGGTVALNGADLSVALFDFDPSADQSFTIIDAAAPVSGSFAEGSVVVSSGDYNHSFPITYNPPGAFGVVLGDVVVADGQSVSTNENTAQDVTLGAIATDNDPLTYSIASGPSHGTLSNFDPATGTVTYTPDNNYHGPDSFTFTSSDGTNTSVAATVSITVVDSSTPVANGQLVSTKENTAQGLTLSASDSDGDTLTYSIASGPSHGKLSNFDATTGTVTYTPDANYHGLDAFTFTAFDGTNTSVAATVSITVVDTTTPMAQGQKRSTNENTAQGLTLTASDSDGDTLTYSIASGPSQGKLSNFDAATGTATYTPAPNYHGLDSFTFTASDGTNTSKPATVSISVVDSSTPVANGQLVSTNENTAQGLTLSASDSDDDTLTYSIAGGPSHGKLSNFDAATGTITYTPDNNYHGPDSFTFTAFDGTNTSLAATVSITVVDTTTPVAQAQKLSTNENTAQGLTLSASDSDGDSPTYSIASSPSHGKLSNFDAATGTVTYTPDANYHGPDSFTFTASDGTNTSKPATVSINVVDSSTPVANGQLVSTNENTAQDLTLSASDSDGDPLTYSIASGPNHGKLSNFDAATGTATYTPDANYHGPDSFTFTAFDGTNTSVAATVSVTVVDTSTPVPNGQLMSTNENTAQGLTLSASDSDGDSPTYSIASGPSHGKLSNFDAATGTVTYTPDLNYHGPDSFTFTAFDGTNTSVAATVSITVVDTTTPVANSQLVSTNENTAQGLTLSASDSDGDSLTYSIASGPSHGKLSNFDAATGTVTYTPDNNYHGPDSFTFTAFDGTNTSVAATVSITVLDISVPTTSGQLVSLAANTAAAMPLTGSNYSSATDASATERGATTPTAKVVVPAVMVDEARLASLPQETLPANLVASSIPARAESVPSGQVNDTVAAISGGGDSGPALERAADSSAAPAPVELLRIYPDVRDTSQTPREALDAVILGKPSRAESGKETSGRPDSLAEASYLLNSSLNQQDDNVLNVQGLLYQQTERAPATRGQPSREGGAAPARTDLRQPTIPVEAIPATAGEVTRVPVARLEMVAALLAGGLGLVVLFDVWKHGLPVRSLQWALRLAVRQPRTAGRPTRSHRQPGGGGGAYAGDEPG